MPKPNTHKTEVEAPLDAPHRLRLPVLLRRAWYGLNQAFRRRCAELEVTPDQYTVLRTLREGDHRGMSQIELVKAMSSDPNTMVAVLRRMAAAGLVERTPHEKDRRAYRIKLSPKGRRKYTQVRRVALALQGKVLGALEPDRCEKFLAELAVIAEVCRECADDR